ncbi:hypothetical protein BS47DRAFT_1337353, partial [Hydnum rufescens UP504]
MLYFGEAHGMYEVLCLCFNYFPSYPIFVSTHSNIKYLAPEASLSRSSRIHTNPEALRAPVAEPPLDCPSQVPGTLTLAGGCILNRIHGS